MEDEIARVCVLDRRLPRSMPPLFEPLFVNYNPNKHARQGELDIIVLI